MLRRDYILEQIKQFTAVLARILGLAKEKAWDAAAAETDDEFKRLLGVEGDRALKLSDTELLARVIEGGPSHLVETRIFMLTALFKASGDILSGQGKAEESWPYHLKGLHLLIDNLGVTAVDERPEFLPTIEGFLTSLQAAPIPTNTQVMLMRHYELSGEFARAEDALFAVVEAEPYSAELFELGASFYQRILQLSEIALENGNLSQAEAKKGRDDFFLEMDKKTK